MASEAPAGYDSLSLPHYSDQMLADRSRSAVRDFQHIPLTMSVPVRRVDMVELFLKAFIAREAAKMGHDFELFNVDERKVEFVCWRSGKVRSRKYGDLDRFQKAHALLMFASKVPVPQWKKKG